METAWTTAGRRENEGVLRRRGPAFDARYWVISKRRGGGTATLVPRLTDGGRVLPVFSSEEEAAAFFLERGLPFEEWGPEEVGAGRLISVLSSPYCSSVEAVTLDPMAGFPAGVSAALVGVEKGRFVGRLLGVGVERGGHGRVLSRDWRR